MVILNVMMGSVWDLMMFVMETVSVHLEKMKKTVVRKLILS